MTSFCFRFFRICTTIDNVRSTVDNKPIGIRKFDVIMGIPKTSYVHSLLRVQKKSTPVQRPAYKPEHKQNNIQNGMLNFHLMVELYIY